jgi:hypothetical protein
MRFPHSLPLLSKRQGGRRPTLGRGRQTCFPLFVLLAGLLAGTTLSADQTGSQPRTSAR